ncbi:hypothetical protein D9M73_91180 [compost metagenome]
MRLQRRLQVGTQKRVRRRFADAHISGFTVQPLGKLPLPRPELQVARLRFMLDKNNRNARSTCPGRNLVDALDDLRRLESLVHALTQTLLNINDE